MLTLLHSDSLSPGFVYQDAVYHVSDSLTHPCRVGYHRVVEDEEQSRMEFYGLEMEYNLLRTEGKVFQQNTKSRQEAKVGKDRVLERYLAFIRCNNLFLFAPKLVVEGCLASDLLIEGDWKLQQLVRTAEGDKLVPRECGEESYSCSFSEMFRL